MKRYTVFLFDIDGTLISSGGAGRRSMLGAFRDVCGDDGPAALTFSYAGMTDRAIVRAGLRAFASSQAGLAASAGDPDEAAIDTVLEAYLARLSDEIARADGYRVLPGVEPILAWLAGLTDVAVGLGTGNVRRGAHTKLARAALDGHFAFGGFGCDAECRIELLRRGAERGARALGASVEGCRVVVIGDTPKDVAAAQGIGAECLGVGTGGFAPEALIAVGADVAFATLDDDGVRNALLR